MITSFRKLVRLALGAALLIGFALPSSATPTARLDAAAIAAQRRVMVMLKLPPQHFRGGNDYGARYGDTLGEAGRLRLARRIARDHRLEIDESWPMRLISVDCVVMRVPDGRSVEAVVAELSREAGVAWSQPFNEFSSQAAAFPTPPYNDRLYAAQPSRARWHIAAMHHMATGRGQTVAVIDSRVDRGHPDLLGQVSSQEDFAPAHIAPAERHGTGVAGIIAARANNAQGIVGVAPDARIMALRACWERPDRSQPARSITVCDSLSLAKALVFAIEHHAGVINLSLSGPQDRLIQTLVETALSRGITVVAAIDQAHPAGSFPAFVRGVIAVDDERLSAKEPGVYIAPGLDIPTTEPGGRWSLVNGTSFAAAHVSGLAALLRQVSAPGDARGAGLAFGVAGTLDACALLERRAHRSDNGCHQKP